MDTELMLRIYGTFYRYVIRFELPIIFLHYSDVVSHPRAVISEILRRCVLDIQIDLATVTEERVFQSIDEHKRVRKEIPGLSFDLSVARPSEAKEKLKCILRDEIADNETKLLSELMTLYENLTLRCLNIQQNPISNIRSI